MATFSSSSSLPSAADAMAGGTIDEKSCSPFECCVCLDLLYKPIVLACGHISCFWCVHRSMLGFEASHCAICRRPYYHFPSICQLLHFLLLKLEPVAYKRRGMEVLEEEKRTDIYSPQFADDLGLEKLLSGGGFEHSDLPENCLENTIERNISVDDVSCSLCKEILYQPAVLNCGHAYCEPCLSDLSGEPLQCQVCGSLHPGELPNVCLDLDYFLEEEFPTEYAVRKEQVLLKQVQRRPVNPSQSAMQTQKLKAKLPCETMGLRDMSDVHKGVGCDSCGMYPIIGRRYKCKDCKEAIGFDLCEACYNTTSKLPGRFNQQHTPDHKFELRDSRSFRNILMRNVIPREVAYVPIVDDPHDNENIVNGGGSGDEEL